jgi:glutathione S-transferase
MYHLTALITLLAVLLYLVTGIRVGLARSRFRVQAPATTGHPDFERAFRVQMNTLEWMPVFLPSLWLFAIYLSDAGAAVIGLIWIVGRILYIVGYTRAADKRGTGFMVQMLAAIALWIGALGALAWQFIH